MASPYAGEIRAFAGNFAPQGWAFCNGQILSIAQNDVLFALIGTTYGGDGQSTFALPDLRGRTLIHQGSSTSGTSYVMGEVGGAETISLITGQLPSHGHSLSGSNAAGTSAAPGPASAMAAGQTGQNLYDTTISKRVGFASQAVGLVGDGQPHENRQPFLAISYIISLFGIFPSQN